MPASAQLLHEPVQVVLQQIPGVPVPSFTQCWFWQSLLAVHGWPSTRVPQLLLTQAIPGAQSLFVVQRVLQAPLAQP
jgi:hypothetical protein